MEFLVLSRLLLAANLALCKRLRQSRADSESLKQAHELALSCHRWIGTRQMPSLYAQEDGYAEKEISRI